MISRRLGAALPGERRKADQVRHDSEGGRRRGAVGMAGRPAYTVKKSAGSSAALQTGSQRMALTETKPSPHAA